MNRNRRFRKVQNREESNNMNKCESILNYESEAYDAGVIEDDVISQLSSFGIRNFEDWGVISAMSQQDFILLDGIKVK